MTTPLTSRCEQDITTGVPDACSAMATYRLTFDQGNGGSLELSLCGQHAWEYIAFNADQGGPGEGVQVQVEPASQPEPRQDLLDLTCKQCAPFDCDDPDRHLGVPERYTPLKNRGCTCGADFDGRDCMCGEDR